MGKKRNNKPLLIILGIAVAFLIIVLIIPSDKKDEEKEQPKTEVQTTEETKAQPETESETKHEIKNGSYDLDEMDIIYSDSVREDVTGNWRLAKITGSKSAEEYALDYYKQFFQSDSEIHALVNFTLNTTACVSAGNGNINVRIYERVEGEEHSAKDLFGGEKLAEYNIAIDTGEITKVE